MALLKNSLRALSAVAAALTLSMPAQAQAQAPADTRPIRIVLGFPAGGGSDTVLRVIAQRLSQQLDRTVIVENKPGGDGIIAADGVAKAKPDGTTLYFGSSSALVTVPVLRGPKAIPYDPFRDFTPVANLGRFALFMVAAPTVPAENVNQLVQYARSRPGELNYASGHSVGRLAAIQLLNHGKIDMQHVPYKGDAAALTDLISGRVHMMFSTEAAIRGFAKDGKLKPLLAVRDARSRQLPGVPTVKEAGVPISVSPWAGLFGPANMPPATVARINEGLRAALAGAEVRERLEQLGFEPVISSPAELAEIHRNEYEVFRKAVHEDGIKFD